MRVNHSCYRRILQTVCLCFLLLFVHKSVNAVEVILNSGTTPREINLQQLKAIYMGQQTQWENGIAVRLVILKNDEKTHQYFVKNLLGLYPYQFNRRWQKLVFSGFAVKPIEVYSTEEMIKVIATTPGSIGYIDNKKELQGVSYAALN